MCSERQSDRQPDSRSQALKSEIVARLCAGDTPQQLRESWSAVQAEAASDPRRDVTPTGMSVGLAGLFAEALIREQGADSPSDGGNSGETETDLIETAYQELCALTAALGQAQMEQALAQAGREAAQRRATADHGLARDREALLTAALLDARATS